MYDLGEHAVNSFQMFIFAKISLVVLDQKQNLPQRPVKKLNLTEEIEEAVKKHCNLLFFSRKEKK